MPLVYKYESTKESRHMCILCKNHFSSQSNLNRHLGEKHGLPSEVVSYDGHMKSFKCLEGCNLSFHNCSGLLYHLKNIHKISVEQEERQFSSTDEFFKWLKLVEKSNNVQYVRQSTRTKLDTITIHYKCSRSGKPNLKQGLKRKRQNCIKIGTQCTSGIKFVETKCNGIKIKFYKTHYGHDFQVQHLHLRKEEKMYVAQKLIDGLSPTEILNAIRNTVDSTKSRRIDLLTKADIKNIKMNIKKGLKWFSLDTQNIKHGIESETSSHISDTQKYNLESVSSELSKRLVESRSPLDHCDESITEPDGMSQTRYQKPYSEDKVHESMAELYETKNCCFFELEQLKHNIEQVSDSRILEHFLEELRTLNRHLESESESRKTLCEFGSENITDEPLSTETFVIEHDHGYT
ncbi:unnamed protein product [Callosobruchus maculatus]|uniref:C2H2-type domain-containing protein n=2 Tax=Callosobruchus maculatus TaxID=64391 RepID=A0A653DLR4_CALMS|nr:unnamed protein product [Callosobruchus maculatus]